MDVWISRKLANTTSDGNHTPVANVKNVGNSEKDEEGENKERKIFKVSTRDGVHTVKMDLRIVRDMANTTSDGDHTFV